MEIKTVIIAERKSERARQKTRQFVDRQKRFQESGEIQRYRYRQIETDTGMETLKHKLC